MKFPKLYAKSSNGKVKIWEIEAIDNKMIIKSGYEDGKQNTQTKEIKGKSIGKINETSDSEQCVLECKSKWQHKLDEQYTENKDNIKSYEEQEVLLPMLALNYKDRSHDIHFPCYVQPKLNGVRCIYQNGKFMSRKGKEYTTLNHLVSELQELNIDIPDGEIYVHGMTLQEIIRRVKKDRGVSSEALEYWIYDQIWDETFGDRTEDLKAAFELDENGDPRLKPLVKLIRVPTILVNSEKEIKELHDKWVKQGFEGAIIRNVDGMYKVKHRSKDLQKFKEFFDDEFKIVGGHEGSGEDKGTVIFEVETKNGQVFSVRPKGTREMRIEWMKNIDKLKGEFLTVRYQNLSESGIPIFPVGVKIDATVRDYE